jgi:uncharacterized protein (DUF2225 family)
MSLEDCLYEKTIECPVCGNSFQVNVVKQKAYIVESRDSDFCVHYKEINPLLYDVWICQLCGYAAQKNTFSDITFKRGKLIKDFITPKWVARETEKIIDYKKAISRFKLALISAQISKAKASEVAGICLKIAWTYRFMEQTENEIHFLQNALEKYLEAYAKERFPYENMDEPTVTYLIGELHRRTGNPEEAATWMSKVINSRAGSERIQKLAREQWQLIKEELKKNSVS